MDYFDALQEIHHILELTPSSYDAVECIERTLQQHGLNIREKDPTYDYAPVYHELEDRAVEFEKYAFDTDFEQEGQAYRALSIMLFTYKLSIEK